MTFGELWRRFSIFLHRARKTEELDEEMRLHVSLRASKLRELGAGSKSAAEDAKRRFGNTTRLKEESRDTWGWIALDRLLLDIRFAFRSLRRNLLLSAVAIVTFALGIGANTAVFSVVNSVLLRPLPYPQSRSLVHLSLLWRSGDANDTFSVPEFEFYRDHHQSFAAVAGVRGGGTVPLYRGEVPEWVRSLQITDGFFDVLGVKPAIGRSIQRADTRPGSPGVALISDSLWRSAFGGDSSLVGRQIRIRDRSCIVVGILPPGFSFVEQPSDVFLALPLGRTITDTGMNTRVMARLKPGVTLAQAQANLTGLFEGLRRQGMAQLNRGGTGLESYQRWLAGDFGTSVLMLLAAVGLLLMIACCNVAGLLLARAASRRKEITVRLALGSGKMHLFRQFLVESLLLAGIGSVIGVLTAYWSLHALLFRIPWDIPSLGNAQIDLRVLTVTLLVTVFCSLFFGILSYRQASNLSLNDSLKSAPGRGLTGNRAGGILVTGEIAISVVLLVTAGLLIGSLYRLHQQKLGFQPDHVYAMTTAFGPAEKRNAAQLSAFEDDVLQRLQAAPGVQFAAVTNQLPLSGPNNLPTQQEGHPEHTIGGMEYRAVTSQYFQALQVPVLRGRGFRQSDTASSVPVAVISESVAHRWWGAASPLGDRIVVGAAEGRTFPEVLEPPRQVIGVVADVKNLAVDEPQSNTVYVPAAQQPRAPSSVAWVVRGSSGSSVSSILRETVLAADRDQRVVALEPLSAVVDRSVAHPGFNALLMGTFAALALLLSAVGLYGLLSFQVARRTQDIGIRMALGADRAGVLLMIVRQGLLMAVTGILFGGVVAFVCARLLAGTIGGIQWPGFVVYMTVSVILLLVAAGASYLPARRASKVDPLIALRYE